MDALDALYTHLEPGLADLLPTAVELVPRSGYCIQCDRPEVVLDAIREVSAVAG